MSDQLVSGDLVFQVLYAGPHKYFSHKTEDYEICLEPCLQGFCVGIYDLEQNLIGEKKCTNLQPDFVGVVFGEEIPGAVAKALVLAHDAKDWQEQKLARQEADGV